MLTVYRIADMIKTLGKEDGDVFVKVNVVSLDEKRAYAQELNKDEIDDFVSALSSWEQDCQGCEKLTKERDAFHADLQLVRKGAIEEQTRADGLLKDVCALEIERDELKAKVAQMTSGVPAGWLLTYSNGDLEATAYDDRRSCVLSAFPGAKAEPLFRAPPAPAQVGELQANYEARGAEIAALSARVDALGGDLAKARGDLASLQVDHGDTLRALTDRICDRDAARLSLLHVTVERDALKARVDTLTAGERLTKDALASAERRAERAEFDRDNAVSGRTSAQYGLRNAEDALTTAKKRAAKAESDCGEWKGRAVTATTDRDEALAAYEAARRARDAAEKALDLAEARIKALEGSGEPVAWDVVGDDGLALACDDEEHADEVLRKHGGRKRALYEAPPPAAIGVIDHGWGVLIGLSHEREFVYRERTNVLTSEVDACSLARTFQDKHAEVVRIVPAKTTIVDVTAIRKALDGISLSSAGNAQLREYAAAMRAAIGEKS